MAARHVAEVLEMCTDAIGAEKAIIKQVVTVVVRMLNDWHPEGDVSGYLTLLEQVARSPVLPERNTLQALSFVPSLVHVVPRYCAADVLRVLVAMVMSTTTQSLLAQVAERTFQALLQVSHPDDEDDLELRTIIEARIAWGVEQLMSKADVTALPAWSVFLTRLAVQCAQV